MTPHRALVRACAFALPFPLTFVPTARDNRRDSEDSRSEDDREEEQGGFWIPFFTDVVQKKSSQILDLEQFGGEVPPCSAWNESPRYADAFRKCVHA